MSANNTQSTVIKKEMGISQQEFHDELPRLLRGIPYQLDKCSIQFQFQGKDVEIKLGSERIRQLGQSLQLPVMPVEISFFDCSEEQIEAFIKHFNLTFLKGGG
ncbi:hypothetical protein SAMN02745165_00760 [Malonomonas rubra DSM 5091]|uniref:Uncharacterized protein n=2 Tax=Malonomonas rubra TaxID=57040 RepID=A0A1M6DPF2_MALRU|nr:hypothetical protein SAMN02745165_00760 [Malonomonas rubra DSM 5091]